MAKIKVDEANVTTTSNDVQVDATVPNADITTKQSITAEVEPDNYIIASQGYSAGVPGWVSSKVSEIIQDSIGNGITLADALDKIKTDLMDQIQLGVNQAISEVENAYVSKSELTTTLASEIDASRAAILDSVQTYADSTQSVASEVNALKASFGNDISADAINAFIGNIALTKATSKEAFAQTVDTLTASYNGLNAQLISTDTVVSGHFTEWDHSSTPQPGMFKIEDGSYWNYIGGTLGENNDGWIRTDKSALDTAEAINLQLTDNIDLLRTQVDGLQETTAGTNPIILTDGNPDELAEPYKTWLATDTANGDTKARLAHTSDIYIKYHLDYKGTKVYDTAYRFIHTTVGPNTDSDGFTWIAITDEVTIDAMNKALQAKDMSDDKRRVFVNTPYPPYDAGDLWVYTDSVTNSKSIKHAIVSRAYNDTYTETDWVLSATDDSYAAQEIARLDTTLASDYLKTADIDGKISAEEQARIQAILDEQNARSADIVARIEAENILDGKITTEEAARKQAALDLEAAYKEYSRIITLAIADGVLTDEEKAKIADAQAAVDAAKQRLLDLENTAKIITQTIKKYETASGMIHDGFIDGEITIFTSISEPSNPNSYDVWRIDKSYVPVDEWDATDPEIAYVTDDGYLYKYYDGAVWQWATANQVALMRSALKITDVKDLADGKVRVFNSEPVAPYDIGDLWIKNEELYKSTVNQTVTFNEDDWVVATKYTDDTVANSKNVVFEQATPPIANTIGDLWIDTSDNNHPKRWNGTEWKTIRDGAIALASASASDALSVATTALNQSDGTITVFYENDDPQAAGKAVGIGDIWIDIDSDPEMAYRWRTDTNGDGTDKWMPISDTGISAALVAAQNAQTTADGKIVADYVDGPVGPKKTSDDVGDLWYDTADHNKPYYWNGTVWVPIQDGTIAIAQAAADVADEKATIADGKAVIAQSTADNAKNTVNNILIGADGYKLDLTQHLVGNYTLNEYVAGEIDKEVKIYSGSDHTTVVPSSPLKSGDLYIEYTTEGTGTKKIDVTNSYRYDGTTWNKINNNSNLIALADRTDGKRTIYGGSTTPVNPEINDMWIPETGVTATDVDGNVLEAASIYLWGLSGWYKATKYTDDSKLNSFLIDGNTKLDLSKAYLGANSFTTELSNQINDNKIEIYSGSDHTKQTVHKEGDLYIETVTITTSSGTKADKSSIYQWNNTNGWVRISHNDNILALADRADGKRTIFGDDPNVSTPIGVENDLWIPRETDTNGTYRKGEIYQYINGIWTAAAYTNNIDSAKKALIDLAKHDGAFAAARAEGEFTIYTTEPANPKAYDILAVPLGSLSLAEYDATSFETILLSDEIKWDGIAPTTQTSITFKYYNPDEENWVLCTPTMFNAIKLIAQNLEAKAFTDSKARVFNIQPFTPYDEGDLWVQGTDGEILRCINSRQTGDYVSSDWEIGTKYTDDSTVIELNNGLKDGSVAVNLAKATVGTIPLSKYVANEADNRVHIYSGTELPENANLEGVGTGDIYIQHVTVTDSKNRKYNSTNTFKYGNTTWTRIDNNKNITNLSDLADGKRTIYAGTTLPETQIGIDGNKYVPEVRDLWIPESTVTINGTTYTEGEVYVYTNNSTWEQKVRYTKDLVNYIDAVSLNSVTLNYQTDGEVAYWFKPSTEDPKTIWTGTNTSHNGDIWYQTDTELGFWYDSVDNLWLAIDDEVTLKAIKSASKLSSAVDGKLTRFYGSEAEMNAETKMQDGDVWFNPDLKISYIYNLTTREWVPVTERSGQLYNAPLAQPPVGNINDIWMVTDRWYTENPNNKKEFVSAPDIDINGDTITNVHKLRVSKIHDGTDWVLQDYDSDTSTHINWIGGASKLLYAPDGGITGWEFQDGSGHQSEFKIRSDKFKISDGKNSANVPFSIVTGSPNKVQFNGVVDFSNVTGTDNLALKDMSNVTTIDGGKITTNTIRANQMYSNKLVNTGAYKTDGTIDSTKVTMEIDLAAGSIYIA